MTCQPCLHTRRRSPTLAPGSGMLPGVVFAGRDAGYPNPGREETMPKTTKAGKVREEELPSTLQRSDDLAKRTFAKVHDAAAEQYGDEERAHRTAFAALKHSHEKVGDHWEPKEENGPSDARAERGGRNRRPTAEGVDANASEGTPVRARDPAGGQGTLPDDQGRTRRGAAEGQRSRLGKGAPGGVTGDRDDVTARVLTRTASADRGSETEAVQVLGVALPVLQHLHPQVEVDGHADQLGDLQAGGRADLLQSLSPGGRSRCPSGNPARRSWRRRSPSAACRPDGRRAGPSPRS